MPEAHTITAVPELNQLHIGQIGQADTPDVVTFKEPGRAAQLTDRLAHLYTTAGPGTHDAKELVAKTDIAGSTLNATLTPLAAILSPDVLAYTTDQRNHIVTVCMGNLAVTSRKPTPEEAANPETTASRALQSIHDRALRETIADAPGKHNIIRCDHILIQTPAGNYCMPIHPTEGPHAILGGHLLFLLPELQHKNTLPLNVVSTQVWQNMSVPERLLFARNESQVYGPAAIIRDNVERVLRGLCVPLGLAHTASGTIQLSSHDVGLTPVRTPLIEPYENMRYILAPGMDRTFIDELLGQLPPDDQLAQARTALEYMHSPPSAAIPANTHLELLDFVISREGRRAIAAVLPGRVTYRILEHTLERIRTHIKLLVGEDAYHARARERISTRAPKKIRSATRSQTAPPTRWQFI